MIRVDTARYMRRAVCTCMFGASPAPSRRIHSEPSRTRHVRQVRGVHGANTWKNFGMSLVQPPSCPQTQGASSSMVPRLRVLMSMILPTTSTHQSRALLRTVPGRPAVRALQVPRMLQIGCERSVPCARAELSPGHSAAARHPVCGPGPHTCERLFANVRVPPRVVGKNGLKRPP